MNKLDVISAKLDSCVVPWTKQHETQVNVSPGNGQPVKGEFRGRAWRGYTDSVETWKAFRIPWKANTSPEYQDSPLTFNPDHIEAIGSTGWNYVTLKSDWVGFDFDSIVNHQIGLTQEQLYNIQEAVKTLPWVSTVSSRSGQGLHIYAFLDIPYKVPNHGVHAAVARATLHQISALSGLPLSESVDVVGGNLWIWHKNRAESGLRVLKHATAKLCTLYGIEEHLAVTSRRSNRANVQGTIPGNTAFIKLDSVHHEILKNLEHWWWDADRNMLVTHTSQLSRIHSLLSLKGTFSTNSEGSETGDHNCYAFPLLNGAFVVRRYGNVPETNDWTVGKDGVPYCYYNQIPSVYHTVRKYGQEHPRGGYLVPTENLPAVYKVLNLDSPPSRPTRFSEHKEPGKYILSILGSQEEVIPGFIWEKKEWKKVIELPNLEPRSDTEQIRKTVDLNAKDGGWFIQTDNRWIQEPLVHVKAVLDTLSKDPQSTISYNILNPWTIVSIPFQPEYPGNRQWNRNSAKLKHVPANPDGITPIDFPTWAGLYEHVGQSLDSFLNDDTNVIDAWAKENGVTRGSEYLYLWVASLLRMPSRPLPFLFFHGVQDSGKSLWHESIRCLIAGGYMTGKTALLGDFNAELEQSIICTIDEVNLSASNSAYNTIKDWVTSPTLTIHPKGKTPYIIQNNTHWVHTANDPRFCPIFPGDTRITSIEVPKFEGTRYPKDVVFQKLEEEAPAFLAFLFSLEIPDARGRLNIPVIETQSKYEVMSSNRTDLDMFIEEQCVYEPGSAVLYTTFFNTFQSYLANPRSQSFWSKKRISAELPDIHKSGRINSKNAYYVSNLRFRDDKLNTDNCNIPYHYMKLQDKLVPNTKLPIEQTTVS